MRLGYGIAASRTRGHPFLNSPTSAAKIKLAPEAKPQMKCVYPSEIACNISVRSWLILLATGRQEYRDAL